MLDDLQKINLILAYKNMTHQDLSTKLGMSKSVISRLFSGERKFKPQHRQMMCEAIGITEDELDNFGNLIADYFNGNVHPNVHLNVHPLPENGAKERYNVIVLEGAVALGNPSGLPSQFQVMADRTLWLPDLPAGRTYWAIKVQGDSMAPFYDDSDTIVVSMLLQPQEFVDDRIYVVVCADTRVLVKRVRPCFFGQHKGTIELVSENPRYASFFIAREDIKYLYEINMRLSTPK